MERLPEPIARAIDPLNRGGGVRPPTPPATKATNTAKGTVYFIQTGRDIKIGWTTCPEQRLKELRTGSPRYLSFLLLLDGKTKQDELDMHNWRSAMTKEKEVLQGAPSAQAGWAEIMRWPTWRCGCRVPVECLPLWVYSRLFRKGSRP